jgi:general secretion pathway protein G
MGPIRRFVNAVRRIRIERTTRRTRAGFTLLEIMIVLAIIGLIAATVGVALYKKWSDARVKVAQIQVREVARTVEQYVITKETCPTLSQLEAEGDLRHAAVDPWGTPLVLDCPSKHARDAADITSYGPDKQPNTDDDIASWRL